jgi:hypothetical protein
LWINRREIRDLDDGTRRAAAAGNQKRGQRPEDQPQNAKALEKRQARNGLRFIHVPGSVVIGVNYLLL